MSTYGFSAFVDGFFKGREYRDGREDRKHQIERQKRMDQILESREGRAAEAHGLDMQGRRVRLDADKLTLDSARRQAANEEEYRRIMQEGMAEPEAPASLGARPPAAKSGTPEAGAAVAGVASNLPMVGAPTRAADAFVRAVPLESLGAKKQTQAGGADADTLAGGAGSDVMGGQIGAGTLPPVPPSQTGHDPVSGLPRLQDGTLVAPAPSAAIADELHQQGPVGARFIPPDRQIDPGVQPMPEQRPSLGARVKAALKPGADAWAKAMQPNYDHQFGQDGGMMGDAAELVTRAPRVAGAVVGGVNEAVDKGVIEPMLGGAANAVNRAINPLVRYATGKEVPLVKDAPFGPGSVIDQLAGSSPPAPDAPLGARPAPPASLPNDTATPGARLGPTVEAARQKEVAQAAQAVGPAAAIAVEEAQKAGGAPLGASDRKPLSSQQRDRAATSAMDRYTTTVVPKLIEAMVRNGDIDRAVKFQEFMQTAETKRAMKDYVHMVVAAGEQDMETFGRHFIAAYNRLGYYNDGTTIVPEQSRFTMDEAGAVNGAVITFRNEATGDTYERVYDDPNQLYMVGLSAADPLNAFTETAARIKSANEAALGAKKAARDDAKAAEKDREKRIFDVAKMIFEQAGKNVLPGQQSPITFDIALEEARRAFPSAGQSAASDPPPLLRKN